MTKRMINDNLLVEIKQYCDSNGIEDVDGLVNKMLTRGFSIEKFGETPNKPSKEPKVVEKVVEKIVEKPVEVIKEVEVEKIVKVSDDAKVEEVIEEMNKRDDEHKELINTFKDNRKTQTQQIMRLNKEKDLMREDFETKIKVLEEKLKDCSKKDMYGE
jgi:CBS domain-containing protein